MKTIESVCSFCSLEEKRGSLSRTHTGGRCSAIKIRELKWKRMRKHHKNEKRKSSNTHDSTANVRIILFDWKLLTKSSMCNDELLWNTIPHPPFLTTLSSVSVCTGERRHKTTSNSIPSVQLCRSMKHAHTTHNKQ